MVFIMALHIELGKLQPDGWIYRDHPNQIVAIYIVITGGVLLLTELISWIVRYGSKLHQRNRKESIE
ncbi:hypothetical protein JV173_06925 [Acholeplasma equirhinis]|uniref:hypothetical protein n=1 Tax=Acholeplasma equirhinis TaxID=555393 RepID=UPI00197ACB5B|nr:hypothetical protein [Acholeplasma equirhinis]MBN3491231.1 hypothetical protein [Acholeplasma equirhinis]